MNNEFNLLGNSIVSYDSDNKEISVGELEDISIKKENNNRVITVKVKDSKDFKDLVINESYRERKEFDIKEICNNAIR